MKTAKRIFAGMLAVMFCALLASCSSDSSEKYSDTTLIIGYTEDAAPFLEVSPDGAVSGFEAELWEAIFDDVKGDLKDYRFEKIEEGYALEDDGGFFDSNDKEYSAGLLMGAVSKNRGTFNKDYSFTEPIISNRIIAVTKKGSSVKSYSDFNGVKAAVFGSAAKAALEMRSTVYYSCAEIIDAQSIDEALHALDNGSADVVITDEFSFNPLENAENYTVLEGELDTIEYVIACAKYSGWKNSINEAIRELKSEEYGDGDGFTPLVEKYFGYNASAFSYEE